MEYLLDTHTAIWLLFDTDKLSKKSQRILENTENVCHVSIASLWEISIKTSLGKLNIGLSAFEPEELLDEIQVDILPIPTQHIDRLSRLKLHHRDPFDRMIIAQAMSEKFTILSMDSHFEKYKVNVLW